MRVGGCVPWAGRKLLKPGCAPEDRCDFGFAVGSKPPYADGLSERDVQHDQKIYTLWARTLEW
eukprot:14494379-Alexandrium_andersonii.AAC.1